MESIGASNTCQAGSDAACVHCLHKLTEDSHVYWIVQETIPIMIMHQANIHSMCKLISLS